MATGYEVVNITLSSTSVANRSGLHIRQLVDTTHLAAAQVGAGLARLTIVIGAGSSGATLDSAWIGESGATPPNFDGNQVQLKFGGAISPGTHVPGFAIISDPVVFSYSAAKNLIVSMHWSGATVLTKQISTSNCNLYGQTEADFQTGATAPSPTPPIILSTQTIIGLVEMLPPVIGWQSVPHGVPYRDWAPRAEAQAASPPFIPPAGIATPSVLADTLSSQRQWTKAIRAGAHVIPKEAFLPAALAVSPSTWIGSPESPQRNWEKVNQGIDAGMSTFGHLFGNLWGIALWGVDVWSSDTPAAPTIFFGPVSPQRQWAPPYRAVSMISPRDIFVPAPLATSPTTFWGHVSTKERPWTFRKTQSAEVMRPLRVAPTATQTPSTWFHPPPDSIAIRKDFRRRIAAGGSIADTRAPQVIVVPPPSVPVHECSIPFTADVPGGVTILKAALAGSVVSLTSGVAQMTVNLAPNMGCLDYPIIAGPVTPPTVPAVPTPPTGATRRNTADQFAIWTSTLGGGIPVMIASDPARELNHARYSPDGTKIIFTRYNTYNTDGFATELNGYEQTEVIVCDANGDNFTFPVPPRAGIWAANANWTPTSTSFIYISNDNAPTNQLGVNLFDLTNSQITKLYFPFDLAASDPNWVGSNLIFSGAVPGAAQPVVWLYLLTPMPAMTNRFVITNPAFVAGLSPPSGDYDSKLSPDGTKAVAMRHISATEWHVIRVDIGVGTTDLSAAGAVDCVPEWSSDGTMILFYTVNLALLTDSGLHTMKPDGTNRIRLNLPHGLMYTMPAFKPGGGSGPNAGIIYSTQKNAFM